MSTYVITRNLVEQLSQTIDKGLSDGLGKPAPGQMCVEAAICYVNGWEHNDEPKCVNPTIRDFSINLNDSLSFKNRQSRAKALKRFAIAQLGTKNQKNIGRKFASQATLVYIQKWYPLFIRELITTKDFDEDFVNKVQKRLKSLEEKPSLRKYYSFVNFLDDKRDEIYHRTHEVNPYRSDEYMILSRILSNSKEIETTIIEYFHSFNNVMIKVSNECKLNNTNQFVEDMVQILINLETDGSKWLEDIQAPENVVIGS